MRRVFSIDIDGVVADIGFIPIMDRTESSYRNAKLLDRNIPVILNKLGNHADLYFVSSRSYKDANYWSRVWLYDNGVDPEAIAGVMCGVVPGMKAKMIRMLHATYHFDDDPAIVKSCGSRGVLVEIAGERNTCRATQGSKPVRTWSEIEQMCYTLPPLHVCYATQQSEFKFA